MTESDISRIESVLNIKLPEYYCSTMLNYPFADDSFAAEFLLPNDPEQILEYNQDSYEYPGVGKLFVIGGDGGEDSYFIDLADNSSQVFTFDMESDTHTSTAANWSEYIEWIEKALKEIEEDEKAEQERKANKKWWEFWK